MYCENQGLTHFQEHQNIVNFYFIPPPKVMFEYQTLVLKMHQNFSTISQATHNFLFLYNLNLGLSCLMSMLERLNELIYFFQFQ
jgi:hypothetical protein